MEIDLGLAAFEFLSQLFNRQPFEPLMAVPRVVASASPVHAKKPSETIHTQFAMENISGRAAQTAHPSSDPKESSPHLPYPVYRIQYPYRRLSQASFSLPDKTVVCGQQNIHEACSAQARCRASNAPYPSASKVLARWIEALSGLKSSPANEINFSESFLSSRLGFRRISSSRTMLAIHSASSRPRKRCLASSSKRPYES